MLLCDTDFQEKRLLREREKKKDLLRYKCVYMKKVPDCGFKIQHAGPLPPVAAGALWAELSPDWVCTDGMMMAMDLVVGRKVVFGLRGLLVDESESWESWTVTQLITLVLWLVAELQEEMKHFSK